MKNWSNGKLNNLINDISQDMKLENIDRSYSTLYDVVTNMLENKNGLKDFLISKKINDPTGYIATRL